MIDPGSPDWPKFVDRCYCTEVARQTRTISARTLMRDLVEFYPHVVKRPAILKKVDLIHFVVTRCRGRVFDDEPPLSAYEEANRWVRFTNDVDAVLFKMTFT